MTARINGAVAEQVGLDTIQQRWGLGAGINVEPDDAVDADAIRSRYARAAV